MCSDRVVITLLAYKVTLIDRVKPICSSHLLLASDLCDPGHEGGDFGVHPWRVL